MQQRIRRVAVVAVATALVFLAVPLAWAVQAALFAAERSELERAALTAAVAVSPDFVTGDAVELPSGTPGVMVGVYDDAGYRRGGSGPARDEGVTRRTAAGVAVDQITAGDLVVAVPVTSGERVVGAVRAASAMSATWARVAMAWGLLAMGVGCAFALALGVARRQARALASPLEEVAQAAAVVAAGDLSARAPLTGVPEVDEVVRAQNVMVDRLLSMVSRERTVGSDIAHQLRTPLTRLELILSSSLDRVHLPQRDSTSPALDERLRDAVAEVDQLQTTVADLLASRRPNGWANAAPTLPVPESVEAAADRWRGRLAERGRRVGVHVDEEVADIPLPAGVVRQVLDVMLDNAYRHGRGAVTIRARDVAGAVAVDVADEGTIDEQETSAAGHRIGLGLAKDLAASVGGRLVLSSRRPTVFRLLLPASAGREDGH